MKRKILIVEDVKLNREIIKRILCNEYDILEAQNGQEALKTAPCDRYHGAD